MASKLSVMTVVVLLWGSAQAGVNVHDNSRCDMGAKNQIHFSLSNFMPITVPLMDFKVYVNQSKHPFTLRIPELKRNSVYCYDLAEQGVIRHLRIVMPKDKFECKEIDKTFNANKMQNITVSFMPTDKVTKEGHPIFSCDVNINSDDESHRLWDSAN